MDLRGDDGEWVDANEVLEKLNVYASVKPPNQFRFLNLWRWYARMPKRSNAWLRRNPSESRPAKGLEVK